jgi:hypothetical protein
MPLKLNFRLKEISNTDAGITWIGPAIDHGDWPFRFLLKLQYVEYYDIPEMLKTHGKYIASVQAASTVAAAGKLEGVAKSFGQTLDEFKALPAEAQHEMLADYGVAATLYEGSGNNQRAVLRAAREKLAEIDFMFGFAMDRPQNALGATGWDRIKGDVSPSREDAD